MKKFYLSILILISFIVFSLYFTQSISNIVAVHAQSNGPTISAIRLITTGSIEKYAKFEIGFDITNSTYTNPFVPYDPAPPVSIPSAIGITIDGLFLPPGITDWNQAKITPCFYYQPYQIVGSGSNIGIHPQGKADFRCRFTPDIEGGWQYKVRAQDANGIKESPIGNFTVIASNRKGFIRVSGTDNRFFEYSDGTPFTSPNINVEEGNPFNSLYGIRTNIQKLGQNGIRLVRWLPTEEGANFMVSPYSGDMRVSWAFGDGWITYDDADTINGDKFSFSPYFYSNQQITVIPGGKYRISFRAKVTGERVLRVSVDNFPNGSIDVCSASNQLHSGCTFKQDGWQSYEFITTNSNNLSGTLFSFSGLYVSSDAPSPYNNVRSGAIYLGKAQMQMDESGVWGGNILYHSNPNAYTVVDQIASARMDELFKSSETYGVYNKLPLFQKNDALLNVFDANGNMTGMVQCSWGWCADHFYSGPNQPVRWWEHVYERYFIARWSYSTSLHSLELANETDLYDLSYNAGWDLAKYVKEHSARNILMSNSFWGYWADAFWTDPTYGKYLDYSDQHMYANQSADDSYTSTKWNDSASYVRQCAGDFSWYRSNYNYSKPIVRGEGGVAVSGTQPQDPAVAQESTGLWYHKKMWAHVGTLGLFCDGDWYPRLFISGGAYPNSTYSPEKEFSAYEKFMSGEPVNNGRYQEIGTDLSGSQQITLTNVTGNIRAWGSRDTIAGKVLLWVDNANQTWKNVSPANASGTVTIPGLPQGLYAAETWNTRTGQITTTQSYNVGSNGNLVFTVSNLTSDTTTKDIAMKFKNNSIPTPTNTVIPTLSPTVNPACRADVNLDHIVNLKDLIQVASVYGTSSTGVNDINTDGKINGIDMVSVITNYGGSCP